MNEQTKPLAGVKLVQMGTNRHLCAINTAEASRLGLERRDTGQHKQKGENGREEQQGREKYDRNSRREDSVACEQHLWS